MGWVVKGLEPAEVEKAIFAAPIGKVSDPLVVAGDGTYIFLVNKEEARSPDANQTAQLKATVFPNWYSVQKAAFDITRDASITGTATN